MEEASGDQSFDQEAAGDTSEVVPEQLTTENGPTPIAESTRLPSHPVIPLEEKELQEHHDAIMRQQMLERQLLNELTCRHQAHQGITKDN